MVNSLIKTDSTAKLIERHKESLNKMHMLHKEAQERIGQKEQFVRYTVPSNETPQINADYREMQGEITNMVSGLEYKVKKDETTFMNEFTDRLRELHAEYRELEKINRELSSMTKLSDDIDDLIKVRD